MTCLTRRDAVRRKSGKGMDEGVTTPAEPQPDVPPAPAPRRDTALRAGVTLAALGVVFGDIGTSPIYALQTVFSIDHGAVRPTSGDVYGVISMVFWSVTLIVSVKYVTIVMRADNDGEGGVLALAGLARRLFGSGTRAATAVLVVAVIGASLFYGDSVITPAISVLSSVEGITVVAPSLEHLVLPVSVTILTVLFFAQRYGTHRVGALFGPVMFIWFVCLALAGLHEIALQPGILRGLSPTYALDFVVAHPKTTFIAMGAIVLCITGAEALYADMGHFGRPPIRLAWFAIAFPALTLNYLGQGGLILREKSAISNPFFLLVPDWARLPMVILATAATVIASQAVISGAYSVSRQASQLGVLPPLTIRQTSEESVGQVYLPVVNGALFVGVLLLMVVFRSSARLATAYGVAVTGTLLTATVLMLFVVRPLWHWSLAKMIAFGVIFGGIELTFLAANLTKVAHGGWLPLLIAAIVFTVMTTWYRGRQLVTKNRISKEGSLTEFIEQVTADHIPRVTGTAVFPHPTKETTPLALRANVEHNSVLHEHVVIVSTVPRNVPHVRLDNAIAVDNLGSTEDGVVHMTLQYGFFDQPHIPRALEHASENHLPEMDLQPAKASYFLSRATLRTTRKKGMWRWRKKLFIVLARNAANPAEYFGLPENQTVIMGSQVDL